MTHAIDGMIAQIEQLARTKDWFGPPRRSGYVFGFDLGRPDFAGMSVVVNEELAQTKTERRSWSERLLSRPWRPWRATKTVPGKPVFYSDGRSVYTCGRGADAIRNSIDDQITGVRIV